MKIYYRLLAVVGGILIIAGVSGMYYNTVEKIDKDIVRSQDEIEIVSLCEKDLAIMNFMFGNELKVDTNKTEVYEGVIFEKVVGKNTFTTLEDLEETARSIYSTSDQIAFITNYPIGTVPMFKEYNGSLYRNSDIYENVFIPEFNGELEMSQVDISQRGNIYADVTVKLDGEVDMLYVMEKDDSNNSWRISSNSYNNIEEMRTSLLKSN